MFFVGLSQGLQNGWLEEVILIFKADDDNDHDEVAYDNDHDEVADDDDHNQQWTKPRIAEWVAWSGDDVDDDNDKAADYDAECWCKCERGFEDESGFEDMNF